VTGLYIDCDNSDAANNIQI